VPTRKLIEINALAMASIERWGIPSAH